MFYSLSNTLPGRLAASTALLVLAPIVMTPTAFATSEPPAELGECSLSGDFDLDGDVDSDDLVTAFTAGKYGSDEYATAFEGDVTGDLVFDDADVVSIFVEGGYQDSGCGYGVPPNLTHEALAEVLSVIELDDDEVFAELLPVIDSYHAYFRSQLTDEDWALLEMTVEQAQDAGYEPLDIFEEFDVLLEDQDPIAYAQLLYNTETALAFIPAGAAGHPPVAVTGVVKGFGTFLGWLWSKMWGIRSCEVRATRMRDYFCYNLRKPYHDNDIFIEITDCCVDKWQYQLKNCDFYGDRTPRTSDYDQCEDIANR